MSGTIELTGLERDILCAWHDNVFNYGTAEDEIGDNAALTDVRELSRATGLGRETVKGVVGSLVKKQLVIPDSEATYHPVTMKPQPGLWLSDDGIRQAFSAAASRDAAGGRGIHPTAKPRRPKSR